ncbi:DNA alkylation repair protein [uncultured Sulfitobacter sp.]|uniref:DNA alkylation repair protein n=1 Tax=uncultured Sulfitobacter sp. TaxID=191468 RepID=UPI002639372A|nr:DNA alkylation repair protein [uncultured Sulfitobacter sp.]
MEEQPETPENTANDARHATFLAQLEALADPERAAGMRSYHKTARVYLGLTNPQLNDLTQQWRTELALPERLDVADGLWQTDIFEARVAAAKLLTQARLRPDDSAAWALIASWVPDFDSWTIADHVCMAGQKRLVADPTRLDDVEAWTRSDHLWTKRAALIVTLPWTKQNNPKPEEIAARTRILGWAADYVDDHRWFIQKAVAWWLRDLSKHDADRVRAFLQDHGPRMKPFAVKEAARLMA